MDIASIVGLIVCIVLVIFAIVSGVGFSAMIRFLDYKSALITLGGAFCCVMASNTMAGFLSGLKSFSLVLKTPSNDVGAAIKKIIELSNVARKEGLLSLEEAASDLDDEFMKKGIMLIVDGTDPELVRGIMETEMVGIEDRHKKNIAFWDDLGAMGPAWGMIGTLIGLINMLQKLDDPSAIGPQMSVALVTTLYGSLIANWLCAPIVGKLNTNNSMEVINRQITIEGLLSIQAGENPRVIEEKLKSFLSPANRSQIGGDNAGGEE